VRLGRKIPVMMRAGKKKTEFARLRAFSTAHREEKMYRDFPGIYHITGKASFLPPRSPRKRPKGTLRHEELSASFEAQAKSDDPGGLEEHEELELLLESRWLLWRKPYNLSKAMNCRIITGLCGPSPQLPGFAAAAGGVWGVLPVRAVR